MKKLFTSCFVVAILFANKGIAQFKCGADEMREKLIKTDPNYKKTLQQMDAGINEYIKAHPPGKNSSSKEAAVSQYYIPCVVHIIYDGSVADHSIGSNYNPSAAQITAAIDYINKVYNGTWTGTGGAITGAGDLQIQLVLATIDPDNNSTGGIDRFDGSAIVNYSSNGVNFVKTIGTDGINVKNLSRWDPEKYYNIWVVNKIDGCDGYPCNCTCDNGFFAGYASFPTANNSAVSEINKDGTLMLASQMKAGQKTLPHEIGHSLNLYHPFEGNLSPGPNTCPPASNTINDGDQCTDTDPVTNPQLLPNPTAFACRTGNNPCSSSLYNDNTEKNYMNYTNCYQLFTNGQKARMIASLNTTQRASLASSWANNQLPYPAPFVAPVASSTAPVSKNSASNVAGILNISLNNNTIYSLNATEDNGYLDKSKKWYDALQISANTTYTFAVKLLNSSYSSQLGVWIDYNNDGVFNTSNEQITLQNNILSVSTDTLINISFTTPKSWAGANKFVRMRLVNDLALPYANNININTSSLEYGQTEDYAIFLTGGALPITLNNFNGTKLSNAIQLNWTTSQSIDIKAIDLERSVNSADFKTITTKIPDALLSTEIFHYKDAAIATGGDYFYRLKFINRDNSFLNSNILKFAVNGSKNPVVINTNFTNNINLIMPSNNGKVSFKLLDATGRLVYTSTIVFTSNSLNLLVPNNLITKGIYYLKMEINGEIFTQKLFKN